MSSLQAKLLNSRGYDLRGHNIIYAYLGKCCVLAIMFITPDA